MNDLFNAIIGITPWISTVIIILLVVRRLFAKRVRASLFRMAWLVLAIRLVLPFDISLPKAPINIEVPKAVMTLSDNAAANAKLSVSAAQASPADVQASPRALSFAYMYKVLSLVWLCGAAVYFTCSLGGYLIYAKRLNRHGELVRSGTVYTALEGTLPIICTQDAPSPMLCGFIKPILYLPHNDYNQSEADNIVRHELVHHTRHDLWLQLVLLVACSISWFNPFIHLMRKTALLDIELACDEKLLKDCSIIERKAYGEMLLNSICTSSRPCALTAEYVSARNIKARFKEILSTQKKAKGSVILVVLCLVCLSASLLISCGAKAQGDSSAALPPIAPPVAPPSSTSISATSAPSAPSAPSATSALHRDASSSKAQSEVNSNAKKEATRNTLVADNSNAQIKPPSLSAKSGDDKAKEFRENSVSPIDESSYTLITDFEGGHRGVDMAAPRGTPIYAMQKGTVITAKTESGADDSGQGKYVVLEHDAGTTTLYTHCSELLVKVGDEVEIGQKIAAVGSTGQSSGNHLHVELSIDDTLYSAID